MTTCVKCGDTGWYAYDHNHSKICDACCTHNQGVWLLTHHYRDAGEWCCRAGCGETWKGIVDYQHARDPLIA